jgi:hypothetical protein
MSKPKLTINGTTPKLSTFFNLIGFERRGSYAVASVRRERTPCTMDSDINRY